jgi:hypothetical protein
MRNRLMAVVGIATAALALTGCAGHNSPEVTPSQSAPAQAAPAPSPTPEPTVPTSGTRQAPLKIGESRKLSDESAWTVQLNASNPDGAAVIAAENEYAPPPAAGEAFLIGNFSVTVDAAALASQGIDLANEGADPAINLIFEYVAADGTSFDGISGTMCFTNGALHTAGTLYADGTTATGDVCLAVPAEKVPGGLWRVANVQNDNLWISPE